MSCIQCTCLIPIQVYKSCLFVVLKHLCWQQTSVCMCTGTDMLQYWLSTGSWMVCRNYCFRALYRYSLHQHTTPKYKLKMSKNDPSELQFVWITQSLFSRFSNSVWSCTLGSKALVKTCFLILLFLHPASLYTSRHSWCRYNNKRDLSDWHIILLALCIVAFMVTKYF